jgi:hypothetical protein
LKGVEVIANLKAVSMSRLSVYAKEHDHTWGAATRKDKIIRFRYAADPSEKPKRY